MNRIFPLAVLIILAVFIFNSFEIDYGAPKPGAAEHYITQGVAETGALNMVTAIYLNYRVYDTLGEATIFFAAALGVYMLLRKEREG